MSTKVILEQTADGWHIEVTDGDFVLIDTTRTSIVVAVHPDEDDRPLKVALE